MELRQLEYFVAVCEELHFTRAAERLGITQPTLSIQIRTMEEELGMQLFDRIGKRITPTEAGYILLKQARGILLKLQDAYDEINGLRQYDGGNLVVGLMAAELDYRLTPILIDFHHQFPKVHLKIHSAIEVADMVINNQVDVGISLMETNDPRLTTIPLYAEEFVLVVSERHELAGRKSVTLETIGNQPLIAYPKGFKARELIETHCRDHGLNLNIIVETSTASSLYGFVRSNVGACLQPYSLSHSLNDPSLRLIKIEDFPPLRQIAIMHRNDKFLGYAAQQFIQLVQGQLKKD
ncbi:LysR family transcriptional regulator [Paenibacillus hunanensis]|uniref:DNA-binding transcriptional LysR family regulator n=1 Tax=Paenibacillus hunanensis TaxID=539262 RepID=A0ABU1J4A1_9BACL|nr:LysR family transcriptional regulator [Paenibacillus hunanensis]MCL9662739.1 LysR family transcriptional regulator [Paenibacillus hunanensis]MDR6245397.1 DNA-binding transcriptional LysR family regulator [Paenibacillus hunanensis]WPP43470.1 LysR family transcriptional regulator [Paenibacillus hunanensis]GGJ27346.1 LysR family transcriptional regulator [Paenibacillus hunanensis]